MLSQGKLKRSLLLICALFSVVATLLIFQTGLYQKVPIPKFKAAKAGEKPPPPKPLYKPTSEPPPPIVDNFPRAASAKLGADLPPIPWWNAPPHPHVNESTPLFIGFTRNWRLLQQVVVSYIAGGWPLEDIYVIENTGTLNSNQDGLLSL